MQGKERKKRGIPPLVKALLRMPARSSTCGKRGVVHTRGITLITMSEDSDGGAIFTLSKATPMFLPFSVKLMDAVCPTASISSRQPTTSPTCPDIPRVREATTTVNPHGRGGIGGGGRKRMHQRSRRPTRPALGVLNPARRKKNGMGRVEGEETKACSIMTSGHTKSWVD